MGVELTAIRAQILTDNISACNGTPTEMSGSGSAICRVKSVVPTGQVTWLTVPSEIWVPSQIAILSMGSILWPSLGRKAKLQPHSTAEYSLQFCSKKKLNQGTWAAIEPILQSFLGRVLNQ